MLISTRNAPRTPTATMQAVRLALQSATGIPYSDTNPAPSSAIQIARVPKPTAPARGQLVVKIHSTSVIRDSLTWSGLYQTPAPAHMGNDFAGVVSETHPDEREFEIGDEVYGMTHADRGATWAEYAMVTSSEASRKPRRLDWAEAGSLPLSALTADQALFVHAGLLSSSPKRVLVTGASGGVGSLLVAYAASAGHFTIAAGRTRQKLVESLGPERAQDIIDYGGLRDYRDSVDVVIDTVGGQALKACWDVVKDGGIVISVDSASYDFAGEHRRLGLTKGKERVEAVFFVVEPSRESMERISRAVQSRNIKGRVAKAMGLMKAREAYDLSQAGAGGPGRIVLMC